MAFLWGSIRWIVAITIVCWAVFIISMVIDRRRYQNAIYLSASVLSLLILLGSVCGKALSSICLIILFLILATVPKVLVEGGLRGNSRGQKKTAGNYLAIVIGAVILLVEVAALLFFLTAKVGFELYKLSTVLVFLGVTIFYLSLLLLAFMLFSWALGKLPKKNDFVAIDLGTDYANYKEIIYTVKNLLGWFTSSITLRETVKKGFIPRIFNNFDGTFECDDLNGVSRYDGENGFENYLADHSVSAFSIIIEAKFGKRYAQKSGEVLYHATDSSHLKRIREQGLIPRSLGNFPDRIYLGSDIHEIENMVGPNLQDMWFLKINVDGLEIYHDERERTAYYTYDNISPDRILKIFQIQS